MKVAFLWHMHQPSYWEADLGRYRYPWAFLHAARHYHMMGVVAQECPEMPMTINVTPVLMEQLDDYARGNFKDKLLDEVRKPADSLDREEVEHFLDHAFKLNISTMVAPYPRYWELRNLLDGTRSKRLREQEIRDLQVWYLLTWTGAPLRKRPEIAELFRKGKQFTEAEKKVVFDTCHQALRDVLPLYRDLMEKGSVEISTTPYYHPILPLLIDCETARESRSNVQLDGVSFHYPQDARWHVEEAIKCYENHFGRLPPGMWPAEGSVSTAALELLASFRMKWAATDEAILARTLGHPITEEERHRPYALGESGLLVYFRDRELSDRVGFVYSSWNPLRAAEDLCVRLLQIRERLGRKEASACVSIILDGENPWEYYPDSGVGFLTHLYKTLTTTPGLEPVKLGDHSLQEKKPARLSRVVPGSWVDGNFDTWIGHPEKNRAWLYLASARQACAVQAPNTLLPREFYRAEGSDWFWWLGPGHDTPYEASYENLFRTNLLQGLAKVGIEPPPSLKVAARVIASPLFQPPLHLFTPTIDGRLGNYYGWIAAGYYRSSEGSLHRAERLLERMRFGFDQKMLYLRAEGKLDVIQKTEEEVSLEIEFLRPRDLKYVYRRGRLEIWERNARDASGRKEPSAEALVLAGVTGAKGTANGDAAFHIKPSCGTAAVLSVAEAGIPLEELQAKAGDVLDFAVSIRTGKDTIDRLPQSGYISVGVPAPDFGAENWSV